MCVDEPTRFDSSGASAHARERAADVVGERLLEGEPTAIVAGGE